MRHLFWIIYLIVGIVIAWVHAYLSLALLKVAASALPVSYTHLTLPTILLV